ncbi:hypothetical protein MOQ_001545 [Trypanosoma cruzi marinkellei]|uniref:DUF7759 domain-containing protein n=1 Tax=Trypanosoma cruzi marinkellei TaxID=85056 RepID=K2NKH8_TRYCR|nr:hypothetical protein MOQ_001545 [Trypanosoma cruzi marinkellei]
MPSRRRRQPAIVAAEQRKQTAETQQQQQQPEAASCEAGAPDEAKKTEAVAPEVSPMAPIPPPTAARQGGQAAEVQPTATPTPVDPTDVKRAVLTKPINKRKPKMAFLFDNEETKGADNGEGPSGTREAVPKRKPKLPFLFNEESTHDGAAAQKQPQPEVPQAHPVVDTAPKADTHIDEMKNETIEKTSAEADKCSAAPTRTVAATPARQKMAISKNVKLYRRMRREPHEATDNTAAVGKAEERSNNSVPTNSTNVHVEMKTTQHLYTEDGKASPPFTEPTESTQNGSSGEERHEHAAEKFSESPKEDFQRQPIAMMSKVMKRSRHLQTCRTAADSPSNAGEHAQTQIKEKVEVPDFIEPGDTSEMAQRTPVCNDQPDLPHSSVEIRAVENTKTAEMPRHIIKKHEKNKTKKSLAKRKFMKEMAEKQAARKQAEEEAARKQAEEEAARKHAEEEAARKQAEEEAARKQAEEEAARKQAEEEAARKQADEEAARRQAEEEEAAHRQAEVQEEQAELSAKERRKLAKKKIERYRKKVAMRQSNPVTDETVVAAAVAQDVMDVPLVNVHAGGANLASDASAAVPSESKLLAEALEFPNSSVTIERFDDNELVARRRSTDDAWEIGLRFDWTIKTLAIGSMPSFSSTDPRRLHPFMQRYQSRPVWFLEEVNGAKANNIREVMDVLKKTLTARFVFRK